MANELLNAQRDTFSPSSNIKHRCADQSTGILYSHNTSLKFPQNIPSPAFDRPHRRAYPCCSPFNANPPSFQPQISALPYQIYPSSSRLQRSKKSQWQNLIKDNREKQIERTSAKIQQQQSRLKECTFQPIVSSFDAKYAENKEIYEKLYTDAQKRKQQRLKSQKQKIQKDREQQTKNNKSNDNRWKILNKQRFDLQPLYLRLQKVIEQKKKNKKMVAQKQQNDYSFKPKVNETSKKIVQKKGMIQNVVDRLINQYKLKQQKMNALKQKQQQKIQKECTYSPTINNFFPKEKRSKDQKNPSQQIPSHYFHPQINTISNLMMQDRSNQTRVQQLFRLTKAPIIQKADRLLSIEAEVYAQCCFNPQINQISKQMTRRCPKHHACNVQTPDSPSHRPKINQVSRLMSGSKRAKSLDNIKKKTREKQNIYKKTVEYQQLKECTFKPKIIDNKKQRKVVNQQMRVEEVAGFKRFIENVQKVQQKERQKKQIEQKLFHLEKRYDQRMQAENWIGLTKNRKKIKSYA